MKRLKGNIKIIKNGDYIKIVEKEGFVIFKALGDFWWTSGGLIVDTNIPRFKTLIGKQEHFNRFRLEHDCKMYRLNKFERWLYEI